ncbi:copper-binding protein [Piscinibacter koreensis]|uniref:Copper-binding protein n=1 Tax=Piscinibacter koreensis TaxID=2742824 RepID=A0A7Y6NSG2_9BURK|nr:copper-binding protein [Schlegelella koreensis]NUZ08490.1 copper-binding protein [Schlegelella koreensis]
MNMSKVSTIALASWLFVAGPAFAANDATGSASAGASASASAATTDGEVRRIDMEAKKITIRHSEIKNLEMPAMTMVFQVKDPSMLEAVKVGDKVRFSAEKIEGAITLTSIETAK